MLCMPACVPAALALASQVHIFCTSGYPLDQRLHAPNMGLAGAPTSGYLIRSLVRMSGGRGGAEGVAGPPPEGPLAAAMRLPCCEGPRGGLPAGKGAATLSHW